MEIIPYTLAENAGLPPIQIVTELRNKHNNGFHSAGIHVTTGMLAFDHTPYTIHHTPFTIYTRHDRGRHVEGGSGAACSREP
ncbi:hypothetical protein EON63_20225 [archaeon]|nr:MAG: hypothetical protein EON63_20225 [archaeon]